jgi:glutamate dehydrogenase/leucine dehydrogenase
LAKSEKKLEVSLPINLDDGSSKSYTAYRVQHSSILGPSIGSIGVFNSTIEDCEALAMLMTINTSSLGLPLGGSKGIICTDQNELSKDELNRLYSKYIYSISGILQNDIIKLLDDINEDTSYSVISAVNKSGFSANTLTNRPTDYFNTEYVKISQILSITQCVKSILKYFDTADIKNIRVGITAEDDTVDKLLLYELSRIGLKLGDIDDSEYICNDIFDLDIYDFVHEYDIHYGDYYRVKNLDNAKKSINCDILCSDVDILILQNPAIKITLDNVRNIKAKYIIEAEENMISSDAEKVLELSGITIIPDFISLGGILINSYIEWSSYPNTPLIKYFDYKDKIDFIISKCLSKIWKIKEQYELTTRDSALLIGIKRLINSIEKRGY